MNKYVSSAIYVHTPETEHLVERLRQHPSQPSILPVLADTFILERQKVLSGVDHVIVSGSLSVIRKVIHLSADYGFSVGVIPTDTQKRLGRRFDIPSELDSAIDIALDADSMKMDLVTETAKQKN